MSYAIPKMLGEIKNSEIIIRTINITTQLNVIFSVESEVCTDNPNECDECINLYDKCFKIPVKLCKDIRYQSQVMKISQIFDVISIVFSWKDCAINIVDVMKVPGNAGQ